MLRVNRRYISICVLFCGLICSNGLAQISSKNRTRSVRVFKTNFEYEKGKPIKGTFQPTITSTGNGTIHLFAQGRLYNSHDNTDKVLLYTKSLDYGNTWSETEFLTPPGSFWGIASYVVEDTVTGKEYINVIFAYSKVKLFELYDELELESKFNINRASYSDTQTTILYQLTSIDNGTTWDRRVLKENFLSKYDQEGRYISFFTPVGQINTVKSGPDRGRLLAGGAIKFADEPLPDPQDIYDYNRTSSSFIYSDDQGESWQLGGIAPIGGNEASVAEVSGDTLIMIRRRNKDYPETNRILNRSYDAGVSWTQNISIESLPSPKCLGILYEDDGVFFYSTPVKKQRIRGWLAVSFDKGESWGGKIVYRGLFSYSDFERVKGTEYYIVAFARLHHGEFGLSVKRIHKDHLFDSHEQCD